MDRSSPELSLMFIWPLVISPIVIFAISILDMSTRLYTKSAFLIASASLMLPRISGIFRATTARRTSPIPGRTNCKNNCVNVENPKDIDSSARLIEPPIAAIAGPTRSNPRARVLRTPTMTFSSRNKPYPQLFPFFRKGVLKP